MTAVEIRDAVSKTRKAAQQGVRAFYSRPIGWLALFLTSGVLAYVGGGAMFWFHAIYRGEAGPPINDWWHWLFDSTLGFVALTPALFLILPAALWAVNRASSARGTAKAGLYVATVGVLFGVATGPGPFIHDTLVGRDAPLGGLAVSIFGRDPEVAARVVHTHSTLSEMILQVAVGVPVYVLTGIVALGLIRAVARRSATA
ncbi:MAG: hypothetical protein LC722_02205 [Actinobacteria bacterium]|nr:hypothetical protein [Actinomycetota bacterium]